MLDGEPHWAGEWARGNNNRVSTWVPVLYDLVAEGIAEPAGLQRASGPIKQDGRGRPRRRYRLTAYGKEQADAIIRTGNG